MPQPERLVFWVSGISASDVARKACTEFAGFDGIDPQRQNMFYTPTPQLSSGCRWPLQHVRSSHAPGPVLVDG